MGKRSRGKERRTKVEEAGGLRPDRDALRYLANVGVPSSTVSKAWERLEATLGSDFANQFESELNRRESGDMTGDVWGLVYRDVETSIATAPWHSPMAISWLSGVTSFPLPDGDVLDLGSGSGLNACYYAHLRPESEVVGIERHPAGVACGKALAERLQLPNVRFLQADIATLDLRQRFAVVCSSRVAYEVDGNATHGEFGFSTMRRARRLFETSTSKVAAAAARHLNAEGTYVSFERLGDFDLLAAWVGAQREAGLSVDLDSVKMIDWTEVGGKRQSAPFMMAHAHGPKRSYEELVACTSGSFAASKDERTLASARTVSLLKGKHFDIVDSAGEGATRLYLISADGAERLYMTTSRGYRGFQRTRSAASRYEDLVSDFMMSGQVVRVHDLAEPHFVADVDRPN